MVANAVKLSVLIPIYATEPGHLLWLREAIDSVRAQGYPVQSVVICDDGSPLPVRGFDDCQILRLESHAGVCRARNVLGEECKTEYLLFLDADDKLCDGALAKLAAEAAGDKIVYGNLMLFGEGYAQRHYPMLDYDCRRLLEQPIIPVTSLHTKAAFEGVGGFDLAFGDGLEEWDYNIRLMLAGVCGKHLPEPILWYRRHPGQRSQGREWLRKQTAKIKDKFRGLEEVEVPCCGGGRNNPGRSVHRNPGTNPAALSGLAGGGQMVLVEYVGSQAGAITIRGQSTGTNYRFSANERQRYVWPQDAPDLLKFPQYRQIFQPNQPVGVVPAVEFLEEQATEVGRGIPSPPDDLTILDGLGPGRQARLNGVGLTRLEDIATADAEFLGSVAGVNLAVAERWIMQARELV